MALQSFPMTANRQNEAVLIFNHPRRFTEGMGKEAIVFLKLLLSGKSECEFVEGT